VLSNRKIAGSINNARPIPVLSGVRTQIIGKCKKAIEGLSREQGRLSSASKEDGESTIVV